MIHFLSFLGHHWLALVIAALVVIEVIANPVASLAILRRVWPYALAIVVGWCLYAYGDYKGAQRVQASFDSHLDADKLALSTAQAAATQAELIQAAKFSAVEAVLASEKADELAKKDRLIADLRAGALRVRPQAIICPRLPGVAAGPGPSVEAAPGQLSEQAQGDLLDIGTDADETAQTLSACQAILKAERQ